MMDKRLTTVNYQRQIPALARDLERQKARAESTEDEDGQTYRTVYLGSVMGLAPSGKYYMPFACGNVSPCPDCLGTGKAHDRRYHPPRQKPPRQPCRICDGTGQRLATSFINQMWLDGQGLAVGDAFPCNCCEGRGTLFSDCACCGGIGSQEAWEDEKYWEALEAAAGRAGGWIEPGAGDPTDVFFCFPAEEDEDAAPIPEMVQVC
jgi:hypothetical protein